MAFLLQHSIDLKGQRKCQERLSYPSMSRAVRMIL